MHWYYHLLSFIIHVNSYAKNEDTQLQFIFEAVPVSNDFPYGAKMTYRAYSCDIVYEIKECLDNGIGYAPTRNIISTFPERGTWLLRGAPAKCLHPAPFVAESKLTLDKFMSKIRKEFQDSHPDAAADWEQFVLRCPLTDNANEYVSMMEVPFNSILFSATTSIGYSRLNSAFDIGVQPTVETFAGRPIRVYQSTASVTHHNRGESIPPRPVPRVEIGVQSPIDDSVNRTVEVRKSFDKMKVCELREALSERGLPTHGLKAELRARLEAFIANT